MYQLFQTQFIHTFFPRCSTPAPETQTRIETTKTHTNQNGEELTVKNSMVSINNSLLIFQKYNLFLSTFHFVGCLNKTVTTLSLVSSTKCSHLEKLN